MKNMLNIKELILIILMLCGKISSGQKVYSFNKVVNNSFYTQRFPNQEHTFLFNSSDESFFMQIYKRNDSLVSRIFDVRFEKTHHFFIDELDSLRLNFIKSDDLKKQKKDYTFEFSEIYNEGESKEVEFLILNKKGKKVGKYTLQIKETEENLFHIFKFSALENLFFNEILPDKNFIVTEAKGKNTNKRYVEYKLDTIQDINLKVQVPN